LAQKLLSLSLSLSLSHSNLNLTPVGSLSGRVKVDGGETGNLGFFVCIAGTSYMAMTDDGGNFTISDVPSGTWLLTVSRGAYLERWNGNMKYPVTAGEDTDLGEKEIPAADLAPGNSSGEETPVFSGRFGDDNLFNWGIYNNGRLFIEYTGPGVGELTLGNPNTAPWDIFVSFINSVTIDGTVTIGDEAFFGCTSLTEISFPAAAYIGYAAFASVPSYTNGNNSMILPYNPVLLKQYQGRGIKPPQYV
jgi:hypothetical protein